MLRDLVSGGVSVWSIESGFAGVLCYHLRCMLHVFLYSKTESLLTYDNIWQYTQLKIFLIVHINILTSLFSKQSVSSYIIIIQKIFYTQISMICTSCENNKVKWYSSMEHFCCQASQRIYWITKLTFWIPHIHLGVNVVFRQSYDLLLAMIKP